MAPHQSDFRFRSLRPAVCLRLAAVLLIALPVAARGAEAIDKKETRKKAEGFQASKTEPIFITSDQMEVDNKKQTIVYRGRVVAVQGEMTMRSDALTARYNPEMKGLSEVIAEGKVHVTQGERTATGGKAVYNGKDQTITLTGNPEVRQGNSQVSGSRIVFFIEQDRTVVEGGGERVKATIFPDEIQKGEKGETRPGARR